MKRMNWKGGLLQAAALGQVLLLAVAGCKPPTDEGVGEEAVRQALVGRDGDLTVNANTVVNGYAALTGTPSPTTVTVADLATFTAGGTRPPLAVGDLVLIIQMAGATITTIPNDATYGTVTQDNYNNAGHYEFAGVAGIDTTTNRITLGCARQKNYTGPGATPPGRAQVIRVPQYGTLRINSGFSIVPDAWNGTVGGVVAVQAATTLQLNGTIDVRGKGFRGGVAENNSADSGTNITTYRSGSNADGAEKGESIAGLAADLPNGGFGRGAPANGGGGGDSHNGGGGGGANASASGTWTGQGVMLSSVTGGAAAWPLDPRYAGGLANSPGGGRGGYTFSNSNQNATSLAPESPAWGGNNRRERGGLGGHPLASSTGGANARLFLGGGGGAGDGNNTFAGSGGPGGGLVFVIAGTVQGAGSILADGANGGPANSGNSGSGDGPGGGGGGGTVVVRAAVLSGISVEANGGVGGIQTINSATEAEGPGGGGGGGYVALSGSLPAGGTPVAISAQGGLGGTTNTTIPTPPATRLVSALSEFPSNGATAGHDGVTETFAVADGNILYCTSPSAGTSASPPDPTTTAVGTFSFTSPQSGVTFECSLDDGTWQACAADDYKTPALSNARHTIDVRARDINGNVGTVYRYPWTVNASGPVVAFVGAPATLTNVAAATFTFSSSPTTGVTFECRVDSATWQTCSSPYTTAPLTDGSHTLEVRGTSGGNTGDSTEPYRWVLDTVAPNAAIVDKPPKVSTSATGFFTFSSDDTGEEGVTFECRIINLVAWKTCSASYTAGPLDYGLYTLEVRARDRAGNVGPSGSYSWEVHLLGLDAASPPDSAVVDGSLIPEDAGAPDTRPDSAAEGPVADGPGSVVLADASPDGSAADRAPDVVQDASVGVLDARADAPDADAGGLGDAIADGGGRDADARDTQVVIDAVVRPDLAPEAQVVVEPALPVAVPDAAEPSQPDAAEPGPPGPAVRIMGAGACAVNPMPNSAPGLFTLFLVAAFGLVVRRRRR